MLGFLLRATMTASSIPSPSKSPVNNDCHAARGSTSTAPESLDIGDSVTTSKPGPNWAFTISARLSSAAGFAEAVGGTFVAVSDGDAACANVDESDASRNTIAN